MKTVILFAALAAVAGTGYAQMNPLPPPSSTDGVMIQPIGLNAGATHWDNPSGLGSFKSVSTTDGTALITNPTYNPTGLPFTSAMPASFQTRLANVNTNGGIIRTIFLGESAGWLDSFGYTYSGAPAGPNSFTAFADMEANPASGKTVNVQYGQHFDVNLAAGAANNFDFWFQGDHLASGGIYTLLHPSKSMPVGTNALWAQQPIMANTWNSTLNRYVDVSTYIVGMEDWHGGDSDYSDGVFAFQFYTPNGAPFPTAVPEPSTYGLIAAAALLGLAAVRRYSNSISRAQTV